MSKMTIGPDTFVNVPGRSQQRIGKFDPTDFYSNQFPFRQSHGLAPFDFPLSLFQNGEQGVLYTPSDMSTMFQDSVGSTPAVIGQPVGLILDKHLGAVRGPEALVNGNFANGAANWTTTNEDATHILTFSNGTLRFQSDTTAPALTISQVALTVGKTYELIINISAWASGTLKTDALGVAAANTLANGVGTFRKIGVATTGSFSITRGSTNVDITIDSISVKEIPGNHAIQATDANRPILLQDSNGLNFLFFDGVNDALSTGNIDFTGTDKLTVFTGITKSNDATTAIFLGLGATDAGATVGGIQLSAPSDPGAAAYAAQLHGATGSGGSNVIGHPAPDTSVISVQYDQASITVAGQAALRCNGVAVGTPVGVLGGGGTFANAPFFIGGRNGTSLFFSGRMYSLIARGVLTALSDTLQAETYVGGHTGIAL